MNPPSSIQHLVGPGHRARSSRDRDSIFGTANDGPGTREVGEQIRVLIVDDHRLLRQGLRAVLELEPGLSVLGEAGDGVEAVQLAHELRPDVVVMDLRMPVMDGIEATSRIHRELADTEVVILSAETDAATIVASVRAGALGCLGKSSSPDELIQAIRAARLGQVYLSSEAAAKLMQEMRALDQQDALTERELDVLRLLVRGQTNAQIAHILGVGDPTVATHVSSIMSKLRVHSRIEVVLRATRLGLVTQDVNGRVG